ncbi:exported hypothetical protein [Verrucomicrobia bacterium]|nr:exported hypothetical protein [Verrucomicrobiota bacterium]
MNRSQPRKIDRREFLRRYGIASSALTLSPFFLSRLDAYSQTTSSLTRVYRVTNVTESQGFGIPALLSLMGGIGQFINPTDIVVIKANGQWPNQGYTHTGCIKAVIDTILAIPGFSGEIIICDNLQTGGTVGATGFDAGANSRNNNWPTYNWNQLASNYRSQGKPVATRNWSLTAGGSSFLAAGWTAPTTLPSFISWNPANGEGWGRYFFSCGGQPTFLSCPVFQSPLTPGRLIDLQNGGGVWEGGASGGYTTRRVKVICMPTLNNHSAQPGSQDAAGVTSAIKCFFGATEIPGGAPAHTCALFNGFYAAHGYCQISNGIQTNFGQTIGMLAASYIQNVYAPVLFITGAIYSGWASRGLSAPAGTAVATNTVLACTNPVTLDYVSCRDVISPYAPWLNPDNAQTPSGTPLYQTDQTNNTRQQMLGCINQGIGTINPQQFEIVTADCNAAPSGTRAAVEQKIRDFKAGNASEQDVKNALQNYMQTNQ